ncbi:MAG: precorrin-4 C(11)-methyltransferase [Bacteroidota bacterium]
MKNVIIIATTDKGILLARKLQQELPKSAVVTTRTTDDDQVKQIANLSDFIADQFHDTDGMIFISALGICVRLIAPHLADKKEDPAVICLDDHGRYVQSVVGGHQGGANDLAKKVAGAVGGQAIISTSSDLQNLWSLDTLADRFDWTPVFSTHSNDIISRFTNNEPTALLLEVNTKGTQYLERTLPEFVEVFYEREAIETGRFQLVIAVTYKLHTYEVPSVTFYPNVLSVGSGCSKALSPALFEETLLDRLTQEGLAFEAVKDFGSIDIKKDQEAYVAFCDKNHLPFRTFDKDAINEVSVPNPSPVVLSKVGVDGVSESSALLLSGHTELVVEKQKVMLPNDEKFTYAVAIDPETERKPVIAIVGAGPGDEELIAVKGKRLLESADCILYAGSLIPEEMTSWCREGAVVRNSASMTLEEQIALMQDHYAKGHKIVRLHSGDPSIYGAIQEQMTLFDELDMDYFIVPGISSFNAAAAVLKSEFTIPEVVQTIIITRGEGKTPLPEAEKLEEMAKLKATICLFLSAGIAKKVETQLLQHYEPDTPVAVLYRLTWKDEEVYTGTLKNLAELVKTSKKKRTVLIVVGQAIHARKNRSQLYSPEWKHIFRKRKKLTPKPTL